MLRIARPFVELGCCGTGKREVGACPSSVKHGVFHNGRYWKCFGVGMRGGGRECLPEGLSVGLLSQGEHS